MYVNGYVIKMFFVYIYILHDIYLQINMLYRYSIYIYISLEYQIEAYSTRPLGNAQIYLEYTSLFYLQIFPYIY